MRIAQVCPYDFARPGGVQIHIRDTSLALQDLGHEVTIIAPGVDHAETAGTKGLQLRRIGRSRNVGFAGTAFELSLALGPQRRALAELMRAGRFDVVHFHSVWTPVMPMQAFLAASGAARVASVHETPPEAAAGFIPRVGLNLLSRLTFPHVDAVIAVSEAPRANVHVPAGRPVYILPPCTDLRRFAKARGAFRKPGDDRISILFAGRLEPRKGAMVLLEAYRDLAREGLPVRLLLAGAGKEEAALRRFVDEARLPDVEFLGAFEDADAPAWFASSDIFCAPSLYGESFGIVIAEAMAAGRPVVAAANRGYRTLLTGEAAPFLTPPGDARALHEALRALALDRGLRDRLGRWGRREAAQYDCRQVAPKLVEIYEAAIDRRAGRKRVPPLSGCLDQPLANHPPGAEAQPNF